MKKLMTNIFGGEERYGGQIVRYNDPVTRNCLRDKFFEALPRARKLTDIEKSGQ